MSETKLCPLTKMLNAGLEFCCMQDLCAWWVGMREKEIPNIEMNGGGVIRKTLVISSIPGHCAILDIGKP